MDKCRHDFSKIDYINTYYGDCQEEHFRKFCKDIPDCYYKQLQNVLKENDKLKQALEEIKEIAEKGMSENICIKCPTATTPPKEYLILGQTFQDREELKCGKCISEQILNLISEVENPELIKE